MLIILLDGFDELNYRNIKIAEIINTHFKKYKAIRLIVTTRSNFASVADLNYAFNTPNTIHICPFNAD
jgi:hypothetical protein